MSYSQLNENDRFLIYKLYVQEKKSIISISKILNRNKSTIYREIKRNSIYGYYHYITSNVKANQRKWHKHFMYLEKYSEFTSAFKKIFNKKFFGVKSTYFKIKKDYPNIKTPSWRQVFNWIKSNRWDIQKTDRLRKGYVKTRRRKIGIFSKFKSSRVMPIWVRPKYIDNRSEFGHWEADFIIGKRSNGFHNLLTFTERQTRMTFIRRIETKNPMKCNSAIYKIIKENNLIVKSITVDNGIEFEKIGLLAHWVDCSVYFCEPYASYQRGSNENINGLIRREWKKGTDFSLVTDDDISRIQNTINNMPREMFNWKSSNYYFLLNSKQ